MGGPTGPPVTIGRGEEGDAVPEQSSAGEGDSLYVLISFSRSDLNLNELTRIIVDLDEVYAAVAQLIHLGLERAELGAQVRPLEQIPRPQVIAVSKTSPLAIQLFAVAAAVPSLRAMAKVLRDPEKIGSFVPKIKSSFYNAEAEAYRARERLRELQLVGGKTKVKTNKVKMEKTKIKVEKANLLKTKVPKNRR
jgi:hypothetical protein